MVLIILQSITFFLIKGNESIIYCVEPAVIEVLHTHETLTTESIIYCEVPAVIEVCHTHGTLTNESIIYCTSCH